MKNTPKGKTLNNKKNNGFSYSSSSTLASKPVSHYKAYTTPSSSSSTILKKQKGPSAASEANTNPSFSDAAWELAVGFGKAAFFVGKTAAIVTAGVVKGIVIAHNQNEHNEKPKETFSCYYTDRKEINYQGTLYITDNQIVFSANRVLSTRSFLKEKAPNPKMEFKIPIQEVLEINKVNAETRCIQIRGVKGSYGFRNVHDYDKAYNHISMGIRPNKPISQLRPNRIN